MAVENQENRVRRAPLILLYLLWVSSWQQRVKFVTGHAPSGRWRFNVGSSLVANASSTGATSRAIQIRYGSGFIKLRKQFHRFAVITVIIRCWRLWRPSVPVPTPYRLWHVAQLKVFT